MLLSGATYHWKGEYPQAIEQYMRSLDIRNKLSPQSTATLIAMCQSNIALAYRKDCCVQDALRYARMACDSLGAVGINDVDAASVLNNAGLLGF
jgi:hypothetical protein